MERIIKIVKDSYTMQQAANRLLQEGKTIVFVPTMGYLHEGHLALMREGQEHGDTLIVSIFVNPTQFSPTEDFLDYPRDLNRDANLAEGVGVDMIFAPEAETMFNKGFQTYVDLERLPLHLCGPSRPGHFRGVATVVTKLFHIVKPHVAVFGEKDYQQLAVVRRLVQDLSFDVRIIGVPTERERDGLAMSSRNAYLSADERSSASSLFQSLQLARERLGQGITDAESLVEEVSGLILSYPCTKIDYVTLCHPETLEDVKRVEEPSLLALAVWVGKTRLIDNAVLTP
ncbi:MAG: pantoate--beta-alanine ligase [Thermodesulfobacteriota bacterium]|nr:pantoate--beta-alanine ligase [Thermodesulfobacteriota bacterium]